MPAPNRHQLRDVQGAELWISRGGRGRGRYHILPHSHAFYELLYISEGARALEMEGRRYKGSAGDLMIYLPGQVHSERTASDRISMIALRFTQELLDELGLCFPDTRELGPVLRLGNRKQLAEVLGRIGDEYLDAPDDHADHLVRILFAQFVVLLQRGVDELARADGGEDAHARLLRIVTRLQRNLPTDIAVATLAAEAGLSVTHFSRLFKVETGEAPKQFLVSRRIERAQHLLRTTDLAPQDVADLLGYSSPFFFYRQFKQRTGMTCSEWRKARAEDEAPL